MQNAGRALSAAGVSRIYLIHGTFAGNDALGILSELARVWPAASTVLRQYEKQLFDRVVGDVGNYTAGYGKLLEEALGQDIRVKLFHWSSENHHLGRADGAVRLLAELQEYSRDVDGERDRQGARVLLWAHSHGGNVLALLTNLLGGDAESRGRFLQAARTFYSSSRLGRGADSAWETAQQLRFTSTPLSNLRLDIVTFGTPIRYGWDTGGYDHLLHFVNHRPAEGLPPYLTRFPPSADDILSARDGDYIQQLGIAGTNIAPNALAWRSALADLRLHRLLQSGVRKKDLLKRLRLGQRVPDEGTTVLVDYGDPRGNILEHVAGHAVYTTTDWMLFHAEQVAQQYA